MNKAFDLLALVLLLSSVELCPAQTVIKLKAVEKLPLEASFFGRVKKDAEGNFYVLKENDHSIVVYDSRMRFKHRIGSIGQGPGELRSPLDFAIDDSGFLYVADTLNSRIQIFSKEGKFIRSIDINDKPNYIAANHKGEIFVISRAPKDKIINVYSREGKLLRSFGEPVKIDFADLTDEELPDYFKKSLIAIYSMGPLNVDKEGNLYLGFDGLPLFRKYDSSGRLLLEVELKGKEIDKLRPKVKQKLRESIESGTFKSTVVISWIGPEERTGGIWVCLRTHIYIYDINGNLLRKLELVDENDKPIAIAGLAFLDAYSFVGSNPWGSYLFKLRN